MKFKCGLLNSAVDNDLDRHTRSFQRFLSENKRNLFFRSLIESPGDLTKDDIADDLQRRW